MDIKITSKEQRFIDAYFECIYFTDTDGVTYDLDQDFERESIIECLAFYQRIACYLSDDLEAQAGHDFWLTRNGHGAGFWDRPEIYTDWVSKHATKIAEQFGAIYPIFENEV